MSVLVVLAGAGCGGGPELVPGGCAKAADAQGAGANTFVPADCSDPGVEYRVLQRLALFSTECDRVPGVTRSFGDRASKAQICLGPKNVDPATAINVVQKGDCVIDIEALVVRRAECTAPEAAYRVLDRFEGTFVPAGRCGEVPGSTATFEWSLETVGGFAITQDRRIRFCLGPLDGDPSTSVDAAVVGDCLRETGADPAFALVDCADPAATFEVLKRSEQAATGVTIACGAVPGATTGIERKIESVGGIGAGYTLCLGPR